MIDYDLIVVGAGASGMISAIVSARENKKVLLLEKLPKIGAKLKATGGGRCNLTNTLSNDDFISSFGRDGRFMQDSLKLFDSKELIKFFNGIGVDTHAPDGFRVFPVSHNSTSILSALKDEMLKQNIDIKSLQRVEKIVLKDKKVIGVKTKTDSFYAKNIIIATGGLGYPSLGAEGDGYKLAKELGHTVTKLYPAMLPLKTKERWVENCRADTIAKVKIRIDIKKHKKLKATGDLIFTKDGIRGPVVLDFAREITPLLEKYTEVPITLNFSKGMNGEQIKVHLKNFTLKHKESTTLEHLESLIPTSLAMELSNLANIDSSILYSKLNNSLKDKLILLLLATPLTISGDYGFNMAMITKGGITLKEIDSKTMQSKIIDGLYFCGEVMNLDGPCGGYNLQWAFSSGYLAGKLK